jgi:hypothetical protein
MSHPSKNKEAQEEADRRKGEQAKQQHNNLQRRRTAVEAGESAAKPRPRFNPRTYHRSINR